MTQNGLFKYISILLVQGRRKRGGGYLAKFIFPRKIGKHKNFKWEEDLSLFIEQNIIDKK